MTLHSVGPADMAEDEQVIGRGYKLNAAYILAVAPCAVAYWTADLKWTVAISAAIIIGQLHESGGRLYDMCIRLRRANLLLRDLRTQRELIS